MWKRKRIRVVSYKASTGCYDKEFYLKEDEPDPARVACVYAHLQSLMVAAGWRKQGLGERLVRAAEAWALEMGAVEVRLDTWEFSGNPPGIPRS